MEKGVSSTPRWGRNLMQRSQKVYPDIGATHPKYGDQKGGEGRVWRLGNTYSSEQMAASDGTYARLSLLPVLYGLQAKNSFYIFKGWKRITHHDTWKLGEIQFSARMNGVVLECALAALHVVSSCFCTRSAGFSRADQRPRAALPSARSALLFRALQIQWQVTACRCSRALCISIPTCFIFPYYQCLTIRVK